MVQIFQVSPAVNVREIDLSTIVPSVATTDGALAGVFRWGPVGKIILTDSESNLAARLGPPKNLNAETFFTGANFLSYGNRLHVVRTANTSGASPILTVTTATGNATVTTTNTANLSVGMIVIAAANDQLAIGTTVASIVNSTAFTVSSSSKVLANGAATAQFVSNNAAFTAIANTAQVANLAAQIVKNEDYYDIFDGLFDSDVPYIARFPGEMGNSLRVSVCDTSGSFTSTLNLASYGNGGATVSMNVGSNTATVLVVYEHDGTSNTTAQTSVSTSATSLKNSIAVTDLLQFGTAIEGTQALKVTAVDAVSSNVNGTVAAASFTLHFEDELRLITDQELTDNLVRYWEFYDKFDTAPGQSAFVTSGGNTAANDELHVAVIDEKGYFTSVPGTVLEIYKGLSRATDAKTLDGQPNYYKNIINQNSSYVWVTNDRSTALSNTALNISSATSTVPWNLQLAYGQDGSDEGTISISELVKGYDLFSSAETIDISLILQGKARGGTAGGQLANYLIDNIAEIRKDCVVFVSPEKADVVNAHGYEVDNIVEFRNSLRSTSYAMLDSGYKYQYDRYNDVYRYIPLNGDIAGLAVRTDQTNDPWWSIAGLNRGQIKNLVRLAWNPRLAQRDELYKNGINPVVTFPSNGTVLFGDKTLLAKPSAFDRINVRRLFIVLEKAISTMAKYFLFEFNDEFTRAQFRNIVTPYLRDIQGRRGIIDFIVKCDGDNNTPEVIDSNSFVGDIYIKPARSINYIQLNFVAVKTGTSFSEVVGRF